MRWVILAILLFAFSVLLNLNLLIYALYAIVAILLVARYVTHNWVNNVTASRSISTTLANVGDNVSVKIEIVNHGRWPITWMIVEDLIPPKSLGLKSPSLGMSGDRIQVQKFSGKQKHHLAYEIKCNRRGYFQIGPTLVETGDMFGFNRKFRVLAEPSYLLVYPIVIPMSGYDVASKRPIGEVIMTNRMFEDPTRIAGVRDYQMGDALNRIHWRLTASTGKLQSKLYEPSSLAGATVVIDFHAGSFTPEHEPVRSELAITAAASITNTLNEMGQQTGLVSNGRDAVDRIRTEGWTGDRRTREAAQSMASMKSSSDRMLPVQIRTCKAPQQQLQIIRALARLELSDGMKLPQLLIESGSRLPRDATVIVILSTVNMENAVAISSLKKQGYSVLVIVNCYSEEVFAQTSAPLIANGLSISHLKNEESIRRICERAALIS